MKKLLLLGGSRYLIPVIEACHALGYYAVTCDYLPDNAAHRVADEYHNVSVTDQEAVLALARSLQIDGILSFACDPGVVTAAYVAEQMGLPFQGSYRSVQILQDKGLFRAFLAQNGFHTPWAKSYRRMDDALCEITPSDFPVIVKPADSAGSKGITRADSMACLRSAIETAVSESRNGKFIIEEYLTFRGCHSSSDCFTVNGALRFCIFTDHFFDTEADNPYVPVMIVLNSTMQEEHQAYLTAELQRLMTLLDMKTGIYNVETAVGSDGKPYIMEVSPRGGGCKIAEIQHLATGIDLIEAELKKAVGEAVGEIPAPTLCGVWCEYVIHTGAGQSGIFRRLEIDPVICEKYIKVIDMEVTEGDPVGPLTGANKALGNMFLRFDSRRELDEVMSKINTWLTVILE